MVRIGTIQLYGALQSACHRRCDEENDPILSPPPYSRYTFPEIATKSKQVARTGFPRFAVLGLAP
jgi:hypothetical protein